MSYLLDTNVVSELRKPAGRAALTSGLVVVTRNTADFHPLGARLLDPWDEPA